MRKPVLIVLSLLGLFDAIYLLWVYTSPASPMVCLGGGCDTVRASSYSHFGGLPLPVYGVVMYAFLALVIFIYPLLPTKFARGSEYAVTGISGLGFIFAAYLTGIEAFVLHAWCIWCVVSALSITAIFVLSLIHISQPAATLEPAQALSMVQTNFALALFAFVVAVPSFVFLTRHGSFPETKPPSTQAMETRLVRPDTHFYGNSHAQVTVVEFGDFVCPACRRAEESAREVREKFGDRIRFAFRQFPLTSLHAQAEKAAEASECAAQQGKFWPAVDKFYANQNDLTLPALNRYAADLGLNSQKFVACLQRGEMASRVRQDQEDGRALGVHATPTFFIDGRMIVGPIESSQFAQLVENELRIHGQKQAEAAVPQAGSPSPASRGSNLSRRQSEPQTPPASPRPNDTMTVLGGGTPNALAAAQDSTACSEAEAKKKQPAMIRTPEAEELYKQSSQALFVDVRPPTAFTSGHIPGALNIPISNFEREWNRLPKDKTIVLYESGRSGQDICAASRAAGRILLAQGFIHDQVKVYQDGLASWKSAGLPVER